MKVRPISPTSSVACPDGNVWMNYGPGLGSNHIVGHIENGKIVGSTYFAGQPYDFAASQRTPGI
jgi:hypothetical protein